MHDNNRLRSVTRCARSIISNAFNWSHITYSTGGRADSDGEVGRRKCSGSRCECRGSRCERGVADDEGEVGGCDGEVRGLSVVASLQTAVVHRRGHNRRGHRITTRRGGRRTVDGLNTIPTEHTPMPRDEDATPAAAFRKFPRNGTFSQHPH